MADDTARVVPPVIFVGVCLAIGALLEYLRPLPIASYSESVGLMVAAVVFLAAAWLGFGALLIMRRNRTPTEPWKAPQRLVVAGPFRITRNPIYVCFVAILLTIAIAQNSLWMIAAAVLLFALLDLLVIRREEVLLTRLFGDEYVQYMSRVRRWLGRR